MTEKEAALQRRCQHIIRIYGGYVFIGLELKREGHLNEVSEAQKIVGQKIKNAGGLWFAIDDSDLVEALMIRLIGGKYDL